MLLHKIQNAQVTQQTFNSTTAFVFVRVLHQQISLAAILLVKACYQKNINIHMPDFILVEIIGGTCCW